MPDAKRSMIVLELMVDHDAGAPIADTIRELEGLTIRDDHERPVGVIDSANLVRAEAVRS